MDGYFYLSYRLAKGWQRLLEMGSGVGCHSEFLELFSLAGLFSRNAKERSHSGAPGRDSVYSHVVWAGIMVTVGHLFSRGQSLQERVDIRQGPEQGTGQSFNNH